MAQFTIYKSTDGSAPTLSGTAGDLVNLLDKCLVAGYGSKTAAGWTKSYTGTNKAAFRQGAGNQFYLRVQDDAAATAKEARVRGYETMSDVDTGTGLFPTVAQATNGQFIRKSATADATTRTWVLVADNRTFYLFVLTGDAASAYYAAGFGDFYSFVSSDGYRTFLSARHTENGANAGYETLDTIQTDLVTSYTSRWMARGYSGVGGPVNALLIGDYSKSSSPIAFPNPGDGGLYLARLNVGDQTTGGNKSVRGWLRGLWQFCHAQTGTVADLDTVSGVGAMAGRTFLFLNKSANTKVYVIETSNTIETN